MSQETAVKTAPPPRPRWLAATRAFMDHPNPEIRKMFVRSSVATFSAGVGLAVEWNLHGKHHPGFRWIVFYASSLISLPLLIWLGLCLLSAFSGSTQSAAPQEHDSSGQSSNVPHVQGTDNNPCRGLAVIEDASDGKDKSIAV